MDTIKKPYIITKYDPLNDIENECPRAMELLTEYGIQSIHSNDTVETAAQIHHMTDDEIVAIVEEINTQLEQEWQEDRKL